MSSAVHTVRKKVRFESLMSSVGWIWAARVGGMT